MSSRKWYQSLYWRIALGLFAFLALMLAAQSALFLWTTDQIAGSMPARSPRRLAFIVATDVGNELASNPSVDLSAYIRDQYGHVFQPLVLIMRDGRTFANTTMPEELQEAVRIEGARLQRDPRESRPPAPATSGRPASSASNAGSGRPIDPRIPRSLPPERPWEWVPVFAGGTLVGGVAVLTGPPPFSRIVQERGPTIAVVGSGVLGVGMVLIAWFVFGAARGRLQQVQLATEQLGGGDLSVRVPEKGGDEVAAVARSFNRMADELASRAQALEASDRARRQLFADVSHELMTPLTAMRGYVETLSMPDLKLDAATRARYLGIIDDETHRLERIVGDLLDLARLEGGGAPLRREPVSVEALFERVGERHEREMAARGVRLVTDVEPAAEYVHGDPDRLEQALQNLAANALRHTPEGGEIRLSAAANNGDVLIRVHDNGPGVPPEHLPLIFDRFYKGDIARLASGGSGLGLSIVKAIVERHGGTIAARNDGGAVFEITLPNAA